MLNPNDSTANAPQPNRPVRTRFAPSPTGYLHLGGARTALYAWAFARHHHGQFILRIEDTDVERSTPEAVQAILDGMNWLQLDWDEGPFYQMQNMARYREQIQHLLNTGHAYHCYCSTEELAQMREEQSKKGLKIRYDGRYRPEPGKTLPPIPAGVSPVVRFKNPSHGAVSWHDMVKGPISIANEELDDLIIARADGTPTYNFCVVVDDLDMNISHVIRGDDHINNTPRQINILKALGGTEPSYGHIPMILGPDGEKLSKRHGAVSVIQYHHMGFLPDAMVNYLARLGWAHGDDEIFSRSQLVEWFDGSHLSKSSAQFDPNKLAWVNAHYLKQTPKENVLNEVLQRFNKAQFDIPHLPDPAHLSQVLNVVLERANTLEALCEEAALFYRTPNLQNADLQAQLGPLLEEPVRAALLDVAKHLAELPELATQNPTSEPANFDAYSQCVKTALKTHQLKMPKLAMPLRLIITGKTQTPSIDAVLALVGPKTCIERINTALRLLP